MYLTTKKQVKCSTASIIWMPERQSKSHENISAWQLTQAHVLVASKNSSSHLGTSSVISHTLVHLLQEQAGGWKWPIPLCSARSLPAPDSQTGSIPSLLLLSKKDHRLVQVCRDLMRSPGPISPPEKRPPRDGCPGPWWDGFWISSGMDNACVGNLDHAPPLPVVISQGIWGKQALLCCPKMYRLSLKRSPVKIPAAVLNTGTLAYARSEAFKSHKYTLFLLSSKKTLNQLGKTAN